MCVMVFICQGDLLLKLAKIAQNGHICDNQSEVTNISALEENTTSELGN